MRQQPQSDCARLNSGGDEPDNIAAAISDFRARAADIMRTLGKVPRDH